jgi:hypothetical protein
MGKKFVIEMDDNMVAVFQEFVKGGVMENECRDHDIAQTLEGMLSHYMCTISMFSAIVERHEQNGSCNLSVNALT